MHAVSNPETARVSILLSARNAANAIRPSLESVRRAMGRDDEVVVIDDGSVDETGIVAARLLEGVRHRIIRTSGVGLTRALRLGVDEARGRFVARLDAGDTMTDDRLNAQLAAFANDARLVVCGGNVNLVDDTYRPMGRTRYPESDAGIRACLLVKLSPLVHSTLMFPRSAALTVGNYREFFRYAQDYDLVLRLSRLGGLTILREPLGDYVVSTGGISATNGLDQRRYAQIALHDHYARLAGMSRGLPETITPPPAWDAARFRSAQKLRRRSLEARQAGHTKRGLVMQASGWGLYPVGTVVGAAVHAAERTTNPARSAVRKFMMWSERNTDMFANALRTRSQKAIRRLAHNEYTRDMAVEEWASQLAPGSRLVDIGSGTCKYARLFSHCTYLAQDHPDVDYAPAGTEQIKSDINSIPLDDASVDAILCTEVLEHVEEPLRAIQEFARILRPGGRLFLSVPSACRVHRVPTHFYGGFAPDFFNGSMARRGFIIDELSPIGNWSRFMGQELSRLPSIIKEQSSLSKPIGQILSAVSWPLFRLAVPMAFAAAARVDRSDDLPLGWIIKATRR